MAFPILGSIAGAALKGLAKSGVIRGTAGKLLGGGASKAVKAVATPVLTGPITGGFAGAAPSVVGKILRGGAAVAGGTVAASALGKLLGPGQRRKGRRMQVTNQRALKRALRRVEGFQKLVKQSFSCTDLKPRKRRCR